MTSTKIKESILIVNARQFQIDLKDKLEKYFDEVEKEWDISKSAEDVFTPNSQTYSPRLDIAVGPFNKTHGSKLSEIRQKFDQEVPIKLKRFFKAYNLNQNNNPRCALAIEIVYSGSPKCILGDITNASMMGLYGIVIANSKTLSKVKRIFEYTKKIREVGKAPYELFTNVKVILDEKFLKLLNKP